MVVTARRAFDAELQRINERVSRLYALVSESVAAAGEAFLADDRDVARDVIGREELIGDLYGDIEETVERVVALQAPVASDLRYLLTVLRIVPELERSGDLAEHIASRAATRLGSKLTPTIRGVIGQMAELVGRMWREACAAFADRDPSAVEAIDAIDDEVDRLSTELRDAICVSDLPTEVAIETALVNRFLERLGDHALHITQRVATV